MTGNYYVTVAL